jgi:hypothetical protein
MILLRLREAVIAGFKAALPGAQVAPHGGTFDEAELKRYAVRSPALLVSVSDASFLRFEGRVAVAEAGVGVALITGPGKKGQAAEAAALAFVPLILDTIRGNRWGLAGVESKPDRIAARNLYSAGVDAGNIALWGISFRQSVALAAGLHPPEGEDSLDDFLTVRLTQADAQNQETILTDDVFSVRTGQPEAE